MADSECARVDHTHGGATDRRTDGTNGEAGAVPHPPSLFWVAAYLTQRYCGGPEEGGWWFDRGKLVTDPQLYAELQAAPRAFLSEADATRHADGLRLRLPVLNEGRRPLDSALSQGIYEIEVIEAATLPACHPEHWPRYE